MEMSSENSTVVAPLSESYEVEDIFSRYNEISKPTVQEIELLCQKDPKKVLETLETACHKGHHDVIHLFMKESNFKKHPIHSKIIDKEVLVDDDEEKPYYNIIKLLLLVEDEMEQHDGGKHEETTMDQQQEVTNSSCNLQGSPDLADTIVQDTSYTVVDHTSCPTQPQEPQISKVTSHTSSDKSRKPQRPKSGNPRVTNKSPQESSIGLNTDAKSTAIQRPNGMQDNTSVLKETQQKRVPSAGTNRSTTNVSDPLTVPNVVVEQNAIDSERIKAPLTRPQTAVGGRASTLSVLKKPIVQSPRTQKVSIEEKSTHREEILSPMKKRTVHLRKTSPHKSEAFIRNDQKQQLSEEEINQWKRLDAFLTRERPRNRTLFSDGQDSVDIDLLRLFAAKNPDTLRDYISTSLDALKPSSTIDHSQREQRVRSARNALLLVIDLITALKYRIVLFVDLIVPALILCLCDQDKRFAHEIAHQALDLLVSHCVSKRLVLEMIECSFLETTTEIEDENSRMINHLGYYLEKLINNFSNEALKKLVIDCEKALFLASIGHMILHAKSSSAKTCLEKCIEQVVERVFQGQEEKFMNVVKVQISHVVCTQAKTDIEAILLKIAHQSKKQNGLQRPQTATCKKKATNPSLLDRLLPLHHSHIKK